MQRHLTTLLVLLAALACYALGLGTGAAVLMAAGVA